MATSLRQVAALDRVLELVLLMSEDMTQSLGRQGLTTARAHLLWELRRSGPTTQQALARAMDVSARNITGLVDGLVANGFVTRQAHPTDRRACLVTFTELGETSAGAMERDHRLLAETLFSSLPDDRFGSFVDVLDEVVDRLRAAVVEQERRDATGAAAQS